MIDSTSSVLNMRLCHALSLTFSKLNVDMKWGFITQVKPVIMMLWFCLHFQTRERVSETGASTVMWWMWLTPFIGQWMISLSGRVNLITSMAEVSREELNAITQRLVSARTSDYDWYTDTPSVPQQEQNRPHLLHRFTLIPDIIRAPAMRKK